MGVICHMPGATPANQPIKKMYFEQLTNLILHLGLMILIPYRL